MRPSAARPGPSVRPAGHGPRGGPAARSHRRPDRRGGGARRQSAPGAARDARCHAAPRSPGPGPRPARERAARGTRVSARPGGLVRALVVAFLVVAVAASVVDAAPWAWLGVRIRDLSEQEQDEIASRHGIREGFGVVIVEVMEGTPAEQAGLKNGDLVVAFEERPVTETRVLQRFIAAAGAGPGGRVAGLRGGGRPGPGVRAAPMPPPLPGGRVRGGVGFVRAGAR